MEYVTLQVHMGSLAAGIFIGAIVVLACFLLVALDQRR